MIATEVLEASLAALNRQAKIHDQPTGERSMGRIVASFNAMTGHTLSEKEGWFFMVLLKMARATTPGNTKINFDDYIDLCAYGALAVESTAPMAEMSTEAKLAWHRALVAGLEAKLGDA